MDVDMNDAPAEAADAIVVEDAPDVAASPNAGGEDSPGSLVHQGTIIDADIAVAEPPPVAPPAFADEAIAPEDDAGVETQMMRAEAVTFVDCVGHVLEEILQYVFYWHTFLARLFMNDAVLLRRPGLDGETDLLDQRLFDLKNNTCACGIN